MKLLRRLVIPVVSALGLISLSAVGSAAEPPDLTAAQIQALVKRSYVRQDMTLNGQLRNDSTGSRAPFVLSMLENTIRFRFDEPQQIIHLDLKDKAFTLREVVKGNNAAVPARRYGEKIRSTDATYEDLSLRFLYWPNPQRLPDEVVKHRTCWKLQIPNPGTTGAYGTAIVWIDKSSGGILRMEGYDRQGHLIKRYEVISGMKVGDGWMLKKLRIESFAPETRKVIGRTYLELEK